MSVVELENKVVKESKNGLKGLEDLSLQGRNFNEKTRSTKSD